MSCFDANSLFIVGKRYQRSNTDTCSTFKHKPLYHVDDFRKVIPFDCVPVAVEFIETAHNIINYAHPERAFYIFGPEDGSLYQEILGYCRDTIYIPTKQCLNLAQAVNVVLFDRTSKQQIKSMANQNAQC